LQARIERVKGLAEKVKETRTAWLEQHGVPISQEFVHFANAIGDLVAALDGETTRTLEQKVVSLPMNGIFKIVNGVVTVLSEAALDGETK
jgi:hypothetical protein